MTVAARISSLLVSRIRLIALLTVGLTAAIAVPFLTMQPTTTASPEPGGPVFDARDRIDERFETQVFPTFAVIEARDGNALAPAVLRELAERQDALRADPRLGPDLVEVFDRTVQARVDGVRTIADSVDEALRTQGSSLTSAPNAVVTAVVDQIVDRVGPVALGLSEDADRTEAGHWQAAALTTQVIADNQALGGGSNAIAIGTEDTTKEQYYRDTIDVLQGNAATFTVFGVAGDVNLTAGEEGERAGPFIGATIAAVLLVVGLTFRSYWSVAVIGGGLGMLIIWLRGISNLIGLESDQVLDTIVPIAMISFGVDFAFHSLSRIREHLSGGGTSDVGPAVRSRAIRAGLAAVLAALALALASDTAAFMANTAAGIESIVQFGVAAVIGLISAFLLLGLVGPVLVAHLEGLAGTLRSRRGKVVAVLASVAAVATVTTSVLLGVFVFPPVGLAVLGGYVLLFLALPWTLLARRGRRGPRVASDGASRSLPTPSAGALASALGRMSVWVARSRRIVLPLVAAVTITLGWFAVQIPTEFDVRDFFASDTDFVVGLDKLDEHIGEQGGEPGQILVEGELQTLTGIQALASFETAVQQLDTDRLARDDSGSVALQSGALAVIRATVQSPVAVADVDDRTGIAVTDTDGDGLPDADEQVAAVLASALDGGVALNATQQAFSAADVAEVYDPATDSAPAATVLSVSVPGSRANEVVTAAAAVLDGPIADLAADMATTNEQGEATLTGSPFVRSGGLDAITRSLLISLPIALIACFVIGAAFMRSVRYGLIAIVPIGLVVAWLYGVMELTGFAINLVTGTIGAISVGIGIDFAIHYIMRFREERQDGRDPVNALRATAEGTGVALVTSAASSIIGFAILAFAPMPLFASYGLLTAVMIAMALVASLLVLPPLLMLTSRRQPVASASPVLLLDDHDDTRSATPVGVD